MDTKPIIETAGKTIWIVEDDEPIARCLQLLLQDAGHAADVALSLSDARRLGSRPDMVLLDYLLPDGNGIAFLPELNDRFPKTPVILLTAKERVGMSSFPSHVTYLAKPFKNKDLLETVQRLFTNRRPAVAGAH